MILLQILIACMAVLSTVLALSFLVMAVRMKSWLAVIVALAFSLNIVTLMYVKSLFQ